MPRYLQLLFFLASLVGCEAYPDHCNNRRLDPLETGTDCGWECPGCGPSEACRDHTDCASGLTCQGKQCREAFCDTAADCANGAPCMTPALSPVMSETGLVTAKQCLWNELCRNDRQDHLLGETDIDCGGPFCLLPCRVGQKCGKHLDCDSGTLVGDVPLACDSHSECRPRPCMLDHQCDDFFNPPDWKRRPWYACVDGFCAEHSCTDGRKNGNESDVDCGGGTSCPRCAPGKMCTLEGGPTWDCQGGGLCIMNRCTAPTCADGATNGNETDTDCGGGTCPGCAKDKKCVTSADCATGLTCVLRRCN